MTAMTPSLQIKEKVLQLDAMLKADNPGMEHWLRDIHKNLKQDESLVQTLTDEEKGILVAGMSKIAQTVIAKDIVKGSKSASGKTKLANLTLDDL